MLTDRDRAGHRLAAPGPVSMHLLVPGAYRLATGASITGFIGGSQCTFWCRVLTDVKAHMYGGDI